MAITTVLFDLDGTLLPMDQEHFVKMYFGLLAKTLAKEDPEALIKGIWTGTKAMMTNDGSKTNEDAFWDTYCALLDADRATHEPALQSFYENEFEMARSSCGYDPRAAQTIALVKSKGLRTALATNPLFPRIATQKRIRWAGLQPEDFEFYTTFEDIGYCKPNPDYYREVLRRGGLDASDCLMVGNDVAEDMMAGAKVGLRGFLLTDCLINTPNADIEQYPHGSFDELSAYIDTLLAEH